jgi:hypothetical protein
MDLSWSLGLRKEPAGGPGKTFQAFDMAVLLHGSLQDNYLAGTEHFRVK